MSATYRVIVNPMSGGGRSGRLLPKVVELMQAAALDFHTVFTRSLQHADELAREAVERGFVVVAMGGDGSISAICAAVADHRAKTGLEATLAIIPAGRGNDFARAMGITSVPKAIDVLRHGEVRLIDLGRVQDRLFLTSACVGLDSEVLSLCDRVRVVKGKSVYAYGAVRSVVRWKPTEFALDITGTDGRTESVVLDAINVVVANTSFYGGGMKIAPDADPEDGCFQVVSIANLSRPKLLSLLPSVFRGTHGAVDGVRMWNAVSIDIVASRPFETYADGERVATTPVRLEIVPNALPLLQHPLTS